MDALIKDESMDFATLKFGKVEKIPEIPPFFVGQKRFSPYESHFLSRLSESLATKHAGAYLDGWGTHYLAFPSFARYL